jgi:hypothetical protein
MCVIVRWCVTYRILYLFVVFNDAFFSADEHVASNERVISEWWNGNKGFGRNWSWPNSKVLSDISMEGLRKTMKKLSQDSRFLGRDLGSRPTDYQAGVLLLHTIFVFMDGDPMLVLVKKHDNLVPTAQKTQWASITKINNCLILLR